MENKTENYIILKPIAERFNRISKEITDNDIKSLIKLELRDQMKKVNFTYLINEIIDDWIEGNEDTVKDMFKASLKEKFNNR